MKNIVKSGIAASALAASLSATPANALWAPVDPDAPKIEWETKTICLEIYGPDGSQSAVDCDQAANNKSNNRPLNSNGCADEQVSVRTSRNVTAGEEFKVNVESCAVEVDGNIGPVQL